VRYEVVVSRGASLGFSTLVDSGLCLGIGGEESPYRSLTRFSANKKR
jgi:hypothetical protein